jgi:hypothetical protein
MTSQPVPAVPIRLGTVDHRRTRRRVNRQLGYAAKRPRIRT